MSNGKGRPRKRLTNAELKEATIILSFDIQSGGRIRRSECPAHGRVNLSFLYQPDDGLYVFCESCGWKTKYGDSNWIH